jgi:tryptophan 2,3-dioxygenase
MPKPRRPVYYAEYLQLDALLDCQRTESERAGEPVHDELLFVIVHQAYELWFKQILAELDAVRALFAKDRVPEKDLGRAVAHLRRVVEIQRVLLDQVDVLETMTPLDFLDFRDRLVPASGFQSFQFRMVENKLGLPRGSRVGIPDAAYTDRFRAEHRGPVESAEEEPSLRVLVDRWLARTPFLELGEFRFWEAYQEAVMAMLARERAMVEADEMTDEAHRTALLAANEATVASFDALFREGGDADEAPADEPRLSRKALQAALLINLYRDEPILHLPFHLLTLLMDVDEGFTTWRYRHALMVQRMIGGKRGTGGSTGTEYLRRTAEEHRVFSDLFDLSTFFIPRSALPELPEEIRKTMSFRFSD